MMLSEDRAASAVMALVRHGRDCASVLWAPGPAHRLTAGSAERHDRIGLMAAGVVGKAAPHLGVRRGRSIGFASASSARNPLSLASGKPRDTIPSVCAVPLPATARQSPSAPVRSRGDEGADRRERRRCSSCSSCAAADRHARARADGGGPASSKCGGSSRTCSCTPASFTSSSICWRCGCSAPSSSASGARGTF